MFLFAVSTFLVICYVLKLITCGRTKSPTPLVGKTAIVTGGNSGVGYQVALNLAARGCKVIIADRDDSEQSRLKIIEHSQNPHIVSKYLDLANFESVRKFAEEINSTESHLEILVNNAGVAPNGFIEDGIDVTMRINYFGPFLLTHLLVDILKKSAPSRIIFTSSLAAFLNNFQGGDNMKTPKYRWGMWGKFLIYNNSKLATIMAADIFAEKLKEAGITSNSIHPGWVRTSIIPKAFDGQPAYFPIKILLIVLGYIVGKSAWEGAQTTIHLAVTKSKKDVTGEFFCDCCRFPKPFPATDRRLAQKIWKISEETVNLSPDEKI